jgi:hypothetical protein
MSTEEIYNLKEEIEDLKTQKQVAEQQLELLTAQLEDVEFEYEIETKPAIFIAEELHRIKCRHNHTDGCSWYYESWENPRHARNTYVEAAVELMNKDVHTSPKEIVKVLRMI